MVFSHKVRVHRLSPTALIYLFAAHQQRRQVLSRGTLCTAVQLRGTLYTGEKPIRVPKTTVHIGTTHIIYCRL